MKYVIELDDEDIVRVLCGMETSIVAVSRAIQDMEACEYPCAGQRMVRRLIVNALTSVTNQIEAQVTPTDEDKQE